LNRPAFIEELAEEAEGLGAVIQTSDRVGSIEELDGDYIVDASGCPSVVKRELGLDKGLKGVSYQQTLEDSNYFNPNTIEILYSFSYDLGYYWIFPRDPERREVNIGVGFVGRVDVPLKSLLEDFKESRGVEGRVVHVAGGLIPIGLQPPFMKDNILFVGDAGVGTFPLTGQGIYRALISGDDAGRCIATGKPWLYPSIVKRKFIKWEVLGKLILWFTHLGGCIDSSFASLLFNWFLSATQHAGLWSIG